MTISIPDVFLLIFLVSFRNLDCQATLASPIIPRLVPQITHTFKRELRPVCFVPTG